MVSRSYMELLKPGFHQDRNGIVKSCDSNWFYLIVKTLIKIKNKNLTKIASDLQPKRSLPINSHEPSCSKLKLVGIARFHDPVTI